MDQTTTNLVYKALLAWDGPSLRPEWPPAAQKALTAAMDELRLELRYGKTLTEKHRQPGSDFSTR
jgi:hypothetical protein